MEDWKSRVYEEKGQLDTRLSKLEKFLQAKNSLDLGIAQKELLKKQYEIMAQYSEILNQRIEIFK